MKYKGEVGILFTTALWGMGFLATVFSLDSNLSPFQTISARFLFAGIVFTIICAAKKLKPDKHIIKAGTVLGFVLFFGYSFQTVGLQYTTVSKNAFLTSTYVIIVPFITKILYKHKLPRFSILGAFIALAGAAALSLSSSFTINTGDFLTIICALFFAFQIYYTGIYAKKYNLLLLSAIQFLVAAIMALVVIIFTKDFYVTTNAGGILALLYLSIFSTTIAFFLQLYFQKFLSETKAAILLSTESVFGALFSVIFLHEALTAKTITGCALILVAVVISEL